VRGKGAGVSGRLETRGLGTFYFLNKKRAVTAFLAKSACDLLKGKIEEWSFSFFFFPVRTTRKLPLWVSLLAARQEKFFKEKFFLKNFSKIFSKFLKNEGAGFQKNFENFEIFWNFKNFVPARAASQSGPLGHFAHSAPSKFACKFANCSQIRQGEQVTRQFCRACGQIIRAKHFLTKSCSATFGQKVLCAYNLPKSVQQFCALRFDQDLGQN